MAKYQHLEIYQSTYELLFQGTKIVTQFPRDHKFTIGQKLKEEVLEVALLIYEINSENDKSKRVSLLNDLLKRTEKITILLRVSKDLGFLATKHYAELSELVVSIGKQAAGWKKASERA